MSIEHTRSPASFRTNRAGSTKGGPVLPRHRQTDKPNTHRRQSVSCMDSTVTEPAVKITVTIPSWLVTPAIPVVLIYRRLRYGYPFRRIPLTRGKFAIVDPQDLAPLLRYKWHLAQCPTSAYAAAWTTTAKNGKRKRIWMHRQILNVPPQMCCDHINHNGLDNRRANLRIATRAQNSANRQKRNQHTRSIYKGLEWDKKQKKWKARISVRGRKIYLGSFASEIDAARAYDRAAKEHHGRFAVPNFPD